MTPPPKHAHWVRTVAGILLGIVGPALFVVLEYNTHCLSGCLFDPMPTPWHFMALLTVPLAHALALVGARWSAPWLSYTVQLLQWPALMVPVYYCIAIGLHLQVFALALSATLTFAVGSWALNGFSWPANGPDRLEAEMTINAILILLPALAVAGWWCLRPWVRACARVLSPSVQRSSLSIGAVAAVLGLCLMELPMVRTYLAIRTYAEGETQGDLPSLLRQDRQVAMVSRLLHSPQQFSSDGALDCEGPVDVFGPAVRLLNRWASPTTMWGRFTFAHHARWGELLDRVRTTDPATNTSPRAWRGLSPWENEELKSRSIALPSESTERRHMPK